jgi:uncharacterized membrane protein YeiH
MGPVQLAFAAAETLTGLDPDLERTLDLVGVFVFAVSGASLAAQKRFDVVGVLALGTATGLGGGLLRDTLLGDLPPVALRNQVYLAMPLLATAVVLVAYPLVERIRRPVVLFDAAGLGLFAVVGAAKAYDQGLAPLPSILLGVMTAVGGGVIRDVLAREVPTVFRADSALYAIPATLGAAATVVAAANGVLGAATAPAIAVAVAVLRLVALRRDWRAPAPRVEG